MSRSRSNRWKAFALIFPIVGMAAATAFAQGPGSQRAFFQAWWGVAAGVFVPTDYLHFWNPAVTAEVDQGPGGLDANSVNFTPDSVNGWFVNNNNKYVQLAGPITNGTSYTVTAWIKPDITHMSGHQFGGWIVSDAGSSPSIRDFDLVFLKSSGNYSMAPRDSSNAANSDQNTNVTHDVWQHLAGVVDSDAGTVELFVDGVSDGSTALTITPSDDSEGTIFGGLGWSPTDPNGHYEGSIGKVRFYQRALTQAEIQAEIDSDGGTGP